jgi:peptidoglycan hydrolase-like protein with peptidoglycan-binding domain
MKPLLRQGSTGAAVRELQTLLNTALKPVPPLTVDSIFGNGTLAAVMNFQRMKKLTPDGVVGPQTWSALEKPGTTTTHPPLNASAVAEIAVQIALAENGTREVPEGSNRGPKVDVYNSTAGVPSGSFWCMSFVYWSFVQAAQRLGVTNPMPKTAYCPFLHSWARQNGKLVTIPQRGDIFLVKGQRDGKPSHIHTGIVTGGNIETIEGNTNNERSRNGIGVFTLTRSASTCEFVRL